MTSALPIRRFTYRQDDFDAWVEAFTRWWPYRNDPAVWGRFQEQAASGRYLFSHFRQPRRHFAETLVAAEFEKHGYLCWTAACVLRRPNRGFYGFRRKQTDEVERYLNATLGILPQIAYEKQRLQESIKLKNMDVIGFNPDTNHWIFTEVKKGKDTMHPSQIDGLCFIRRLYKPSQADVFISWVTKQK